MVNGKYVPTTEAEAARMIAKGDLKFRLNGKRLKGDFALIKMRGRRPGSKGNEWLMIKKHDEYVVEGYEIEGSDESVLSGRTLEQIAGDSGSREWKSRPTGRGKLKAAWLADAIARVEKKKKLTTLRLRSGRAGDTGEHRVKTKKTKTENSKAIEEASGKSSVPPVSPVVESSPAAPVKRPMPTTIHPMLAESVDKPFDGGDWLFEIKWDGYRAVTFIENGKVRLVSRNQNDLTGRYPELKDMAQLRQGEDGDSRWRGGGARPRGQSLIQPDAAAHRIP